MKRKATLKNGLRSRRCAVSARPKISQAPFCFSHQKQLVLSQAKRSMLMAVCFQARLGRKRTDRGDMYYVP
jgi:hypothetical protein